LFAAEQAPGAESRQVRVAGNLWTNAACPSGAAIRRSATTVTVLSQRSWLGRAGGAMPIDFCLVSTCA
jgi:hypothetical protein